MSKSQSVGVAMSTFNGAKYLIPQIESILAQDHQNLTLVVRDDGSMDDTVEILKRYAERGKLELIQGENVGVVRSFIELIGLMAERFDYIALCDQDDVWYKNKISRAVSILENRDLCQPQLYCSEYMFCDESLNPVARSKLNCRGVSFNTMLYENRASGNTMLMNSTLARIVKECGSDDVYCHDWWIALVATSLGSLYFDNFTSLDYRRIGNNASPTGSTGLPLLRYRVHTFLENGELECITRQLRKLYVSFHTSLDMDKCEILKLFLEGGRLRKFLFPHRLRQTVAGEFALRLLFLFGEL